MDHCCFKTTYTSILVKLNCKGRAPGCTVTAKGKKCCYFAWKKIIEFKMSRKSENSNKVNIVGKAFA